MSVFLELMDPNCYLPMFNIAYRIKSAVSAYPLKQIGICFASAEVEVDCHVMAQYFGAGYNFRVGYLNILELIQAVDPTYMVIEANSADDGFPLFLATFKYLIQIQEDIDPQILFNKTIDYITHVDVSRPYEDFRFGYRGENQYISTVTLRYTSFPDNYPVVNEEFRIVSDSEWRMEIYMLRTTGFPSTQEFKTALTQVSKMPSGTRHLNLDTLNMCNRTIYNSGGYTNSKYRLYSTHEKRVESVAYMLEYWKRNSNKKRKQASEKVTKKKWVPKKKQASPSPPSSPTCSPQRDEDVVLDSPNVTPPCSPPCSPRRIVSDNSSESESEDETKLEDSVSE